MPSCTAGRTSASSRGLRTPRSWSSTAAAGAARDRADRPGRPLRRGPVREGRRRRRRSRRWCGAELTLETADAEPIRASRPARPAKEVPTDTPRLVLIAADKTGYGNLARTDLDRPAARAQARCAAAARRSRRPHRRADRAFGRAQRHRREGAAAARHRAARRAGRAAARSVPGRFYLELQHHIRPEDPALLRALVRLAAELDVPYVATNGVAYATRGEGRSPTC